MAVFKCKMCGANLEISENQSVAVCDYCGANQTIPVLDSEKKLTLFNRANRLRFNSEFDSAIAVYENIVAEFPEEAEAYWGLVLCHYGIEYVDDPQTGKKVPTCHRTVPASVMDDENFKLACEYADTAAKSVYREEAKAIDRLQQQILSIVQAEEPYDVFICYKENDDCCNRTEDSGIAQDIYTELIKEGYRVFFARVTLRDKAGSEYEPYIYAALSSAKVMLAIGTKYEYYDSVWVKNEWSRYLAMMQDDKTKHLIPCFKNLDAYDIPKEFKNLQALNMADITFFKSLNENIKRFVSKKQAITINTNNTQNVDALLKRAFMFLEDGDFTRADDFCEQVLNIDPENAQAYLGKLMVECKVRKLAELENCEKTFENSANYQKAVRYGNSKLTEELKNIIIRINERFETANKDNIYNKAKQTMVRASTEKAYIDAAKIFESLNDYKDSISLQKSCLKEAETLKEKKEKEKQKKKRKRKTSLLAIFFICVLSVIVSFSVSIIKKEKAYNTAVELFEKKEYVLSGQALFEYKDSDYSSTKKERIEEMKQTYYVEAEKYYNNNDYYNAAILYGCADNYKDAWDKCVSTWRKVRQNQYLISASFDYSIGLNNDGSVVSTTYLGPYNDGQTNVGEWDDITSIVASNSCSFGLRKDGTVAFAGSFAGDVSHWENIVEINAFENGVTGLKEDGTVVASGNSIEGVDVSGWKNMIYAIPGTSCVFGVDYDGNVLMAPGNDFDDGRYGNYQKLKDIVMVSADIWNIYALRADGMVIKLSNTSRLILILGDISSIYATSIEEIGYGIIALDSYDLDTIALYNDGHVGFLAFTPMEELIETEKFDDVIAVSIGQGYIIRLKEDGTLVSYGENKSGATCVQDWKLY